MQALAVAFFSVWLRDVFSYGVTLAATFGVLMTAETVWPRDETRISLRSRLKAMLFWAVWVPVTVPLLLALAALWQMTGIKPLVPFLAAPGLPRPVGLVAAALLAAMVGDFFYYWCHRFQHRFLWRFHAVHHSVREMSGFTAYHHVTEAAMKFVLYGAPLSMFTDDPYSIPILGGLLGIQGHYLHSTTRLNFGRLGRFLQDNRFHRIHHSIHPEHYDRNFAVFTTFWDWLFGTAYFPAEGEWPETGVLEMPEPETVGDFLVAPLRMGRVAEAAAPPEVP
jgi:sterol desaturase/sphingolipid hydroxylase (fatty acid hydroxylase superfamily)